MPAVRTNLSWFVAWSAVTADPVGCGPGVLTMAKKSDRGKGGGGLLVFPKLMVNENK